MELAEVIANVDAGRIPASIYSDPDIFALERERLFPRTWQFLAHESEIPEPGDYVVRRIVDDSFIVSRGQTSRDPRRCSTCAATRGCRSAGPRPATRRTSGARTTRGRTATTAGWSACRSTRRRTAATPGSTRRRTRCCRRRTSRRTAGSCSPTSIPAAMPLEDALGDFRFFLDLYLNQSEDGVELRGPQRWRVEVQLEDRRRELRRRLVPHAAHPRERGRHRAVPRADGEQAQGGGALLRRRRWWHHVQDPAGRLRPRHRPRRLSARDGRADAGDLDARAAGARRRGRVHGVGGDGLPEPELRAQLAADPARRRRRAVHLDPAVATGRARPRPSACRGSPSTATRRRRSRPTRTRRTSCASARRGCSSRTTSRTGRRSRA